MSASREDYLAFAKMIQPLAESSVNAGELNVLGKVVEVMADAFADDSPRFKREVFYKACGLNELQSGIYIWDGTQSEGGSWANHLELHVGYPHDPGYLIDCPACEYTCHCADYADAYVDGPVECVRSGHEVKPA